MTWLETTPMLQFVDWGDRYEPYPISWDEQTALFQRLPPHLTRMVLFKVNTGCREQVGLKRVRIHDLKHTFGRRLRAAGVPLETRKVLLGHKSGDITTHYSGPELEELLEAANRVCGNGSRKSPALVVLRKRMA